jgi:hypothetical protein
MAGAAAATASAAAAAVAEHAAGSTTWLGLQLPVRFGFLSRAQLLRRRSSRTGAAGSRDSVMQWASVDGAGEDFSAPLLQYDMQEQVSLAVCLDSCSGPVLFLIWCSCSWQLCCDAKPFEGACFTRRSGDSSCRGLPG